MKELVQICIQQFKEETKDKDEDGQEQPGIDLSDSELAKEKIR